MSAFKRDQPNGAPSGQASHIASGTRVEGAVVGAAEVLLDGEVVGDVRLEAALVLGPGGRVKGSVTARSVRVAGQIEGPVRAAERIELATGSRVIGDIAAPRIVVAEGAYLEGRVEMVGGSDKTRPTAAAESRSPSK